MNKTSSGKLYLVAFFFVVAICVFLIVHFGAPPSLAVFGGVSLLISFAIFGLAILSPNLE